ncbi:unnamed protein product [Durusdinium trenchii]|uniref:EF-hand domain-containing protein n=1 Tax=Durusdinium trenchii TaxID=1381693 RepID=A0ABP0IBR9_9DINO
MRSAIQNLGGHFGRRVALTSLHEAKGRPHRRHCDLVKQLLPLTQRNPSTLSRIMSCADATSRAAAAFDILDVDGDGILGQEDISMALEMCGFEAEAATIADLAAGKTKASQTKGVPMDSGAFEALVKQHSREVVTWKRDVLAQAVTAFGDPDFVDADHLTEGLCKLGLGATKKEALEMLKDFDKDADGKLSRDELVEMLGCA